MRAAIAASVVVMCLDAGLVLAQSRTGEIAGKVTDIEGAIIPGARVTVKGRETRTTESDKSGEYAFKNLRRGSYTVRVELVGFETTTASVSVSDKAVRLDVVLRVRELVQSFQLHRAAELVPAQSRQGEIVGKVTFQGDVISGVSVALKGRDSRTTETDKNGEYVLKNLRRGTYVVRFELAGFEPTDVKVSVGAKPVQVDAVLRLGKIWNH